MKEQLKEHAQIKAQARHLKLEYSDLVSAVELTESECSDGNPGLVHFADELINQAGYAGDLGAGLTRMMREIGVIAEKLDKGRRSPRQTAQELFRLALRLNGFASDSFVSSETLLTITRQLAESPEGL